MTDPAFPSLLRFWRDAYGVSQEGLAFRCDVSVRHLSYLENGRARPSPEMVGRLATGLELEDRERAALFLSAGFAEEVVRLQPCGSGGQPEDWSLMLQAIDPRPAAIVTPLGDVLTANSAWLALHRMFLADLVGEGEAPNALVLFLHPSGWRRHVAGWRDIGMAMLAIARQEAVLMREACRLGEIDRLARLAGFEEGWPAAGARLAADAAACGYSLRTRAEPVESFRVIYTQFGVGPNLPRGAPILQTIHPLGEEFLSRLRRLVSVEPGRSRQGG